MSEPKDDSEVGDGYVDTTQPNDLQHFPGREFVVGDDPPEGFKLPVTGTKAGAFKT
jgi:hypothetical protein